MKLFEALKEGKRANLTLLSELTSGSVPDTAITDTDTDPREKGRDLTRSYDNLATQKRHQNFDYTTISDRLRTVSWSIKRQVPNWCG